MTVTELFQAGKLKEAIEALGEEVRNSPLDTRRRTFLFELLCFAGEYDRAEKHLAVLSDSSSEAHLAGLLYRSAIHAEKNRQQMFLNHTYPQGESNGDVCGIWKGQMVKGFCDADERMGLSLEVFVAGSYTWISLKQIASIEVPQPRRLRDLLWTPAIVKTLPAFRSVEPGEVLLPALCPLSSRHADDAVRLGRVTVWQEGDKDEPEFIPFGQKMFLIDGQEVPIFELGKIELMGQAGEERVASA